MPQFLLLPHFKKQLKPYAKKHHGFVKDLLKTLHSFDERQADSLGHQLYKVRMGLSDRGRGKSGGFRVIIFFRQKQMIIPLTLHAKSEQANMEKKEINDHYEQIMRELLEYEE